LEGASAHVAPPGCALDSV